MLFPLLLALLAAAPGSPPSHAFSWANPRPQGNPIQAIAFENTLKGYCVGRHGTVLVSTDGGAMWQDRTRATRFTKDLEDVAVTGPDTLVAVGAAPGIYLSQDGGRSFAAIPNPSTGALHDVDRIGASVLNAIGDAGQVLRSLDGGLTWTAFATSAAAPLFEQFWFNASRGYVVGMSVALQTANGGQTWTPVPDVDQTFTEYAEVFFTDALHGAIVGDFGIWETSNGGTSWTLQTPKGGGPVYMAETVAFDALHWIVSTDLEGAMLWETLDGGDSWDLLRQQGSANGFTDLERLSDGKLLAATELGDLIVSTDGGASFTNTTFSAGGDMRVPVQAMTLLPNGRAFAGGTDNIAFSLMFVSDDHGVTWHDEPSPSKYFTSIAFENDLLGVIGGERGIIARTIDGGAHWAPIPLDPNTLSVIRIEIPDATVMFASALGDANTGTVFRSRDHGASWQRVNNGLPNQAYFALSFPDRDTGFVGAGFANGSWLYRTSDGGDHWQSVGSSDLPDGLRALHFRDATHGVLAAWLAPAAIYLTEDGGQSWAPVAGGRAMSLDFLDAEVGYATLADENAVLATQDGGAHWTKVPLPCVAPAYSIAPFAGGFLVGGNGSNILVATEQPRAASSLPRHP